MSFSDGVHRRFGQTGRVTFCTDGRRTMVDGDSCSLCGDPIDTTKYSSSAGANTEAWTRQENPESVWSAYRVNS